MLNGPYDFRAGPVVVTKTKHATWHCHSSQAALFCCLAIYDSWHFSDLGFSCSQTNADASLLSGNLGMDTIHKSIFGYNQAQN